MVRRSLMFAGLGAAVAFAAAPVSAQPAAMSSTVHRVHAGQSIQSALDSARPGDVIVVDPGTYRENLTIRTDGLTLRGAGAGVGGTRLALPDRPSGACVETRNGRRIAPAICVEGRVDFATFTVIRPVRGVHVSGFAADGFFAGMLLLGVNDAVVEHSAWSGSDEDGIVAALVRRPRFAFNILRGNGGGIRVAPSPQADAVLVGNRFLGNRSRGIAVEDSDGVRIEDNTITDSAAGIIVLDLPGGGRPRHIVIDDNDLVRNNRLVREGRSVVTGSGILLLGAVDSVVTRNRVRDNRAAAATPLSGGVVVRSTGGPGRGAPQDVLVRANIALDNRPFDLRYDGSGANVRFVGNVCRRSQPGRLC